MRRRVSLCQYSRARVRITPLTKEGNSGYPPLRLPAAWQPRATGKTRAHNGQSGRCSLRSTGRQVLAFLPMGMRRVRTSFAGQGHTKKVPTDRHAHLRATQYNRCCRQAANCQQSLKASEATAAHALQLEGRIHPSRPPRTTYDRLEAPNHNGPPMAIWSRRRTEAGLLRTGVKIVRPSDSVSLRFKGPQVSSKGRVYYGAPS